MPKVYAGLGSNLGHRGDQIFKAIWHIMDSGFTVLKRSAIEETFPVEKTDQPKFLNAVVLLETDYTPRETLEKFLLIEKQMGRERTTPKGPRIIDIDLLLYDERIINENDLVVPHPEIRNRAFVLRELLQVNPTLVDPVTKKEYRTYYEEKNRT
jgi:2-amino-4-hydroxy-6-hydroxymethyldihydropteridine diphosphokinase